MPDPVPAYLRQLFDDPRLLGDEHASLAADVGEHRRCRRADSGPTMRSLLVHDRWLSALGLALGG